MSVCDTDLSVLLSLFQCVRSALCFFCACGLALFPMEPVRGRMKDCDSYLLTGDQRDCAQCGVNRW